MTRRVERRSCKVSEQNGCRVSEQNGVWIYMGLSVCSSFREDRTESQARQQQDTIKVAPAGGYDEL